MNHLFFKSPNPKHSHNRHHLRAADILFADEDHHSGADSMDVVGETPLSRNVSSSIKCYSPRRLVLLLLSALRLMKKRRVVQRKKKRKDDAGDLDTPSFPLNEANECENSGSAGQLDVNDTAFKLGVGCGFLYMMAASKNELRKMVELRKEMEMLIQNVKGELQNKDALLKSLKQSEALACSTSDIQEISISNSHPSIHSKTLCVQPESESNIVFNQPSIHSKTLCVQSGLESNIVYNSSSIHSKTLCVQPESESNIIYNRFLEYNTSEQDDCAEELSELQAEFEAELERLEFYLEREAALKDEQQERMKVTIKEYSSSKSHSSSFGEIIMDPHEARADVDVSFGVPPVELERRLHELLEARLQERIKELESALECTTRKLIEKQREVTWWKETTRLFSHNLPETARFTFQLDSETDLNLSQAVL